MSLKAVGWFQRNLGVDINGEYSSTVWLCVGGSTFMTTLSTLKPFESHPIFGPIYSGRGRKSEDGLFLIDRDGDMFRFILHFMRSGQLHMPHPFGEWDMLLQEVRSLQLPTMEKAIEECYEYQMYRFRKAVPQGIFVHWPTTVIVNAQPPAMATGASSPASPNEASASTGPALARQALAVSIAPPVPSLSVSEDGRSVLFTKTEGTPPVVLSDLDSLVTLLLSVYGYEIQHWREKEGKVFFALPSPCV